MLNMAKMDDKLKLAEEFGMTGFIAEVERQKELMAMKFKLISESEIEDILSDAVVKLHGFRLFWSQGTPCLGIALIAFASLACFIVPPECVNEFVATLFVSVPFGLLMIFAGCCGVRRSFSIRSVTLEEWYKEIPYGAMLAVKEAKDLGHYNFRVWFPSVKADPIISAYTPKGNMVMIYAWDDGVIHE